MFGIVTVETGIQQRLSADLTPCPPEVLPCPGISDRTASQAVGRAVSGARTRLTSRVGRAAQDVVNTGLSLITLSGGETAVQVPAGYQFYLVKSRRK